MQPTIHTFRVAALDGGIIDFSEFRGRKLMVVNTASECGLTPQYAQLQELYEHFADRLVIVGSPCNDFGGQEPGSAEQIQAFCQQRYGVTFPLTEKVRIAEHPLWQWLTQKAHNGVMDSEVQWNFQKYLLDEAGHLVRVLAPATSPFDDAILDWLRD